VTLAWHFVRNADGKLLLRDGREVPPLGEWLEHDGPVAICASGLHASYRALDALRYCERERAAACLVEVECVIAEQTDKLVCRRRRVVAVVRDADETLRLFARLQALSVIHMWDAPQVVREYLETGDESLRAAASAAARAAARAAASDVACAAARAAAWAAARGAWAASDAAASANASANAARTTSAWVAARAAAWAAARDELELLLLGQAEWAPGCDEGTR